MVLLALAACAACCAVAWAAVVVFAARRRPTTQRAPVLATHEEDHVRPAVDSNGERIWVAEDELFWHEIVRWSARRPPQGERDAG